MKGTCEHAGNHDASSFDEITRLSGEALKRMRRAHDRGTGCRIKAEEIRALSLTLVGEWWSNMNDDGSSFL